MGTTYVPPGNLANFLTRPHSALTDLGGDQHPNHALLDGRSGGQIFYGGAQGSEALYLRSNPVSASFVAVDDHLQLWPSMTSPKANFTLSLAHFSNSISKVNVSNPWYLVNVEPGATWGTVGGDYVVIRAGGFVANSVGPAIYQFTIFKSSIDLISNGNNSAKPFLPDAYTDNTRVIHNGASAATETAWVSVTLASNQTISALGADYTLGNPIQALAAVYFQPNFHAGSGHTLTVSGPCSAVFVRDPDTTSDLAPNSLAPAASTPNTGTRNLSAPYGGMWVENLTKFSTVYALWSLVTSGTGKFFCVNTGGAPTYDNGNHVRYNGDTTVGNGLTSVVGNELLTARSWGTGSGQSGVRSLFVTNEEGLYGLRFYMVVSSAGNSASTIVPRFFWVDDVQSQSFVLAAGLPMTTLGTFLSQVGTTGYPSIFRAASGTLISYSTSATNPVSAGRYLIHVAVERLA